MRLVDADGRVFGRVNLVDALCLLFVLVLVPSAYVSWLLFRPAVPQIRSIEPATITVAEQRIANGLPIRMKVKVRGDHLAPLLRATIGGVPAIGFTFETPQSADVIIGEDVPFGTHDLVLYDGIQEVARARGAITVLPPPTVPVRAVGALVQLDQAAATRLHKGLRFDVEGHTAAAIVELGEVEPDRAVITDGAGRVEPVVAGQWRRPAIVALHCDPDPDASICRVGKTALGDVADALIDVPGTAPPLRMRVAGMVPDAPPRPATVRVRLPDRSGAAVRAGDRDARWPSIDPRAAVVVRTLRPVAGNGDEIDLRAGVDRGGAGWRYHGLLLVPGAPFTFVTDRYAVAGTIESMVIDEQ